jgi:hypothetical protein
MTRSSSPHRPDDGAARRAAIVRHAPRACGCGHDAECAPPHRPCHICTPAARNPRPVVQIRDTPGRGHSRIAPPIAASIILVLHQDHRAADVSRESYSDARIRQWCQRRHPHSVIGVRPRREASGRVAVSRNVRHFTCGSTTTSVHLPLLPPRRTRPTTVPAKRARGEGGRLTGT